MKNKLKSQKGLTLIEMLCVVVLVVIMSALLTTGVALAANTMSQSVTASEAKILCDTLTTKLSYYIVNFGYNDGDLKVNDVPVTEGAEAQFGELKWKDTKLVPAKTYPASAAASLSVAKGEAGTEDEGYWVITLSVANASSKNVYCSNIIRVGGVEEAEE